MVSMKALTFHLLQDEPRWHKLERMSVDLEVEGRRREGEGEV